MELLFGSVFFLLKKKLENVRKNVKKYCNAGEVCAIVEKNV